MGARMVINRQVSGKDDTGGQWSFDWLTAKGNGFAGTIYCLQLSPVHCFVLPNEPMVRKERYHCPLSFNLRC